MKQKNLFSFFVTGHSRTIIGIEQRSTELTLLILDPSHGPRQVAALGSSQDSLRLIRRGPAAMRAPQYQIVAVRGLIDTEEQYQVSEINFFFPSTRTTLNGTFQFSSISLVAIILSRLSCKNVISFSAFVFRNFKEGLPSSCIQYNKITADVIENLLCKSVQSLRNSNVGICCFIVSGNVSF